jgi:hypothetical protein
MPVGWSEMMFRWGQRADIYKTKKQRLNDMNKVDVGKISKEEKGNGQKKTGFA